MVISSVKTNLTWAWESPLEAPCASTNTNQQKDELNAKVRKVAITFISEEDNEEFYLPNEMWLKVFHFLSPRDKLKCTKVCSSWMSIALEGFPKLFSVCGLVYLSNQRGLSPENIRSIISSNDKTGGDTVSDIALTTVFSLHKGKIRFVDKEDAILAGSFSFWKPKVCKIDFSEPPAFSFLVINSLASFLTEIADEEVRRDLVTVMGDRNYRKEMTEMLSSYLSNQPYKLIIDVTSKEREALLETYLLFMEACNYGKEASLQTFVELFLKLHNTSSFEEANKVAELCMAKLAKYKDALEQASSDYMHTIAYYIFVPIAIVMLISICIYDPRLIGMRNSEAC